MSQGYWLPTEPGYGATALGVPPTPPGKKRGRVVRIGIVAALVVGVAACLVIGFWGSMTSAPDDDPIAAGDCAKVWGTTSDADLEKVDCVDPQANYRVAVRVDNATDACPSGDYAYYQRAGLDGYRLCLTLNAAEGECFEDLPGSISRKADCALGKYRAGKIVRGTTDRMTCGTDTTAEWALVYSTPERLTICMRKL
ncbi:LppU/SCO3897 family protein [Nocardia suismassiliense]|uniref:LppU/SCO3897 family protein n=1 Tax=Nocardia suismassiliense TaxID=2077092 RepID=UPI000D1FCD33|nr:hypothetical protein [Nocardia suismassiliense]